MRDIKMWKFQINVSGETQGWNDNGIQTFRQNILKSLAREIIQNSIDARQDNGKPVKVEFRLEKLSRIAIPGVDELQHRLESIINGDGQKEGEAHISEIEEAYDCISKSALNVLIVSDSNTVGMPYHGEDTSSPLFRYIKATGSSGGSQARAGSHGLGKAAPLATSPLRTIYVSTLWDDSGVIKHHYQGRTRLMSLTTSDGIASGTGYWGTNDYQPLTDLENSNFDWLRRTVAGSTVAVPGFRTNVREWSSILAGYVVSEFFGAIHNRTLEVTIVDSTQRGQSQNYTLNSRTLTNRNKLFKSDFIKNEIQNYLNKNDESLSDAEYFYDCLNDSDPDLIERKFDVEHLGPVRLRLRVSDGAPRKVCLIRRDMKITDNLQSRGGMWSPGHVPPKIKDFCGVIDILSEAGERIIRSMEPPQHDDLSPDNMPEKDREEGRTLYKDLSQKIRKIIEEYATAEVVQERIVSELSEYFYDDTEFDANAPTVTQEQDPNGRSTVRLAPLKVTKTNPEKEIEVDADNDDDDGGAGGDDGSGGGGTSGHGGGRGAGTGGSGGKGAPKNKIRLHRQRIWKKGKKYRVSASVNEPFIGDIHVFEVGLIGHELIKIKSTSHGSLKSSGVVSVQNEDFASNKLVLDIEFETVPIGGLTIVASGADT